MFKISKRTKDRLPMITPGIRDADVLPSSGSSMSSGLSLDYSALSIGGVDTGVPINHTDDHYDDIYDNNGFVDIVKLWNSNPNTFENEVHRLREYYDNDDWQVSIVLADKLNNSGLPINLDDYAYGDIPMAFSRFVENVPLKFNEKKIDIDIAIEELSKLYLGKFDSIVKFDEDLEGPNDGDLGIAVYFKMKPGEDGREVKTKLYDLLPHKYKGFELRLKRFKANNASDNIIPYNVDNYGNGSFVGAKEDGFPLKHNLNAFKMKLSKRYKLGFPDYPQYSDPQMYSQVSERNETTPLFDIFNTYFCLDNNINDSEQDIFNKIKDKEWDITQWHHSSEYGWHADILYGDAGLTIIKNKDVAARLFKLKGIEEKFSETIENDTNDTIENHNPINIFNKPLEKRDWDENIGDHYIWNVMLNEFPDLMNPATTQKDIDEWVHALKWRMGIEPKYHQEIKNIINEQRKIDWNSIDDRDNYEYGKLIVYLRKHTYQDPDWIKKNTYHFSENDVSDTIEIIDQEPKTQFFKQKELLTYDEASQIVKKIAHYFQYRMIDDPVIYNEVENNKQYILPKIKPAKKEYWDDYESTKEAYDLCSSELSKIPGIVSVTIKNHMYGGENRYFIDIKLEIKFEEVVVIDGDVQKQAFIKTAIAYDSNPIIQKLISIPQIKSLIEQHAVGFVDEIKITTPSTDIQQTQQKLNQDPNFQNIQLQQPAGSPFGHMFTYEDPQSHQHKAIDKIVRIDRVTDEWGTLITVLHEISHHRHPEWGEPQVESEAINLANTVKQFINQKIASINKKRIFFAKNSFKTFPLIECEIADTLQKQIIGLQKTTSLKPEDGMLFTYAKPQALSFHMGIVAFPIDIIFADHSNKILKIYRNCKPNSMDIYSCDNSSKVIEVVGSFCAFHDINEGDQVFLADDESFDKEAFIKFILEKIREIKLIQQKDLKMNDWNIKIVMEKNVDENKFIKVDWEPEDYKIKKAEILINPEPILIKEALKKMSLEKLIRHALLHILVGKKEELPEDKEKELITNRL